MKKIIFLSLIFLSLVSFLTVHQSASGVSIPNPTITIDQMPPVINNNLVITVRDYQLADQVPSSTISVTLRNSNTGASNVITLTERGDTGVFVLKYMKFTGSPGPNDLAAAAGDGFTVTYTNPNNESRTAVITGNTQSSFTDQFLQKTVNTEATQCSADGDNDGLCDSWETSDGLRVTLPGFSEAYTYPCDPVCPDPTKPDVYVEVDYMNGHDPDLDAIDQVKNAFAMRNVNLHVQVDENVVNHKPTTNFPGSNSRFPNNAGFDQIKEKWHGTAIERQDLTKWNSVLWPEKRAAFHYALFVHSFAGNPNSSGIAEKFGNDFMISLGAFTNGIGSTDQQAGTFMHELGHNLNLDHGGPLSRVQADPTVSTVNCKPNYLSVMSYSRQFRDLVSDRALDYSNNVVNGKTAAAPLSELRLDESGVTAVAGSPHIIYGPVPPITLPMANGQAIDWNNNNQFDTGTDAAGSPITVSADANSLPGCPNNSSTESYTSYVDWSELKFKFRDSGTNYSSGTSADRDQEIDDNGNAKPESKKFFTSKEFTVSDARNNRGLRITALECFLNLDNSCRRPQSQLHYDYLDATPIQIIPVQLNEKMAPIKPSFVKERTDYENYTDETADNNKQANIQTNQIENNSNTVSSDSYDNKIYQSDNPKDIVQIKEEVLVQTNAIKKLVTTSDDSLQTAIDRLKDLKEDLGSKLKSDAYESVSDGIDDIITSYQYALKTQPNAHVNISPQEEGQGGRSGDGTETEIAAATAAAIVIAVATGIGIWSTKTVGRASMPAGQSKSQQEQSN